jgi:hypothetical protein
MLGYKDLCALRPAAGDHLHRPQSYGTEIIPTLSAFTTYRAAEDPYRTRQLVLAYRHGAMADKTVDAGCTPSTATRKRRKPHTPMMWARIQPLVKRYYIDQDMTLEETMHKLSIEHDFDATYALVATKGWLDCG